MAHDLPNEYFFTSHVTHNRRQNEAIHALDAQISVTRDRLNSEMRRISGSLEQRLERLSTSFDAFVELSDLRAVLAVFTAPATVRYRAHRLVEGAATRGEREEVPGYWLCPAERGLAAAVRGDAAGARSGVAGAADIDALRAGTFALLGTAAAAPGQAPVMADWILPKVLTELPGEVARYQRALWTAAADGLLGDDARTLVRGLAEQAVRRGESDDPAARPDFWVSAAPAAAPPARSRVLDGGGDARTRVAAAARLAALRTWLEKALTPQEDGGEGEAATEEARDGRAALDEDAARTLRLLVDEGTAEEAPYLLRANQLRAVIESGGTDSPDTPTPSWTDPAGDALELLRTDATGDSAPQARRALAIGAYAPAVEAAAKGLAAQAAEPVPAHAEVVYQGHRLRVTADGADDVSMREAEASLESSFAPDHRYRLYAAATAGAAVLLGTMVGVAGASPALWIVPVAVLAAAGGLVYSGRKRAGERADALESARRRLRDKAREGAAECREMGRRGAAAADRAAADLREVRRLLAAS